MVLDESKVDTKRCLLLAHGSSSLVQVGMSLVRSPFSHNKLAKHLELLFWGPVSKAITTRDPSLFPRNFP